MRDTVKLTVVFVCVCVCVCVCASVFLCVSYNCSTVAMRRKLTARFSARLTHNLITLIKLGASR